MALSSMDEVARALGIDPARLLPRTPYASKLPLELANEPRRGKLVLVSSINPTKWGEGKTTCTIGLVDGLRAIGVRAAAALRQPSIGPVFGVKGGGAGGGEASLVPLEEVNLGLTGDFDALAAAHNTLAAMADSAAHFRSVPGLEARGLTFRRVVDVNDRALRRTVLGLSRGEAARESGFDITAASELMAILCLARDRKSLRERLSKVRLGRRDDGTPVTAEDVGAVGAMMVLLRHALYPNLVQTKHGTPVLVHGGPFGNIAHGCSSIIGTRAALATSEVAVTEAGFGFDLGGEKFLDIACREGEFWPDAAVIVATVRALKWHGGADDPAISDVSALERGLPLLLRHLENARKYGLSPVVAINRFPTDSAEELALLQRELEKASVPSALVTSYVDGPKGGRALAELTREVLAKTPATPKPRFLYEAVAPLQTKIEKVAKEIYGAARVELSSDAKKVLAAQDDPSLLVCMAKTPVSFTADPSVRGVPAPFALPVREIRISAGAGFAVVLCGDIETMPGLGRVPAALKMDVDDVTGEVRNVT